MTIFFDPFIAYGFAGRVKPMNGVQPFTYRDGVTFLRVLEELIAYVNQSLVNEVNVTVEDIVAQINVSIEAMETAIIQNEDEFNNALLMFMNEVDLRISAINEKTGPLGIQRIFLTSDFDLAPDDTWPGNHPMLFQVMQDHVGDHNVLMFSRNLADYPVPVPDSGVWNSLNPALYTTNMDIGGGARDGSNALVIGRTSNPSSPNTIAAIANVGGERTLVDHATQYTVSVRVRVDTESRVRFRINQWDSDDLPIGAYLESPYTAIEGSDIGEWVRVHYTFFTNNNNELDALNVDLWVDLPNGVTGPASGAYTSVTDCQIEKASTPSNFTGRIENPDNYQIENDPYSLSEFTLIPEPSGIWRLSDPVSLAHSIRQELEQDITDLDNSLNQTITSLDNSLNQTITSLDNRVTGDINALTLSTSNALATKVTRGELVANVKDHGVIGDGLADDSAAINAALLNHDVVYFPPGIYKVSSPVKIPSNTVMYGAGVDQTTIMRDVNSPGDMTTVCTINYVPNGTPHMNYVENVEVSHMTIDGNSWNMAPGINGQEGHGEGSALTLAVTRHAYIHDMIIKNADRHCLDIMASHYAQMSNANYVVPGPSEYIVVERVQAYSPRRDDAFTVHDSRYVTFRNCYAEWESNRTMSANYQSGFELDDGTSHSVIENCYAKGFNIGFVAKGHDDNRPAQKVTFIDCIAESNTRSFYAAYQNFNTVDGTHEATDIAFIRCTSLNRADQQFTLNNNRDLGVYGYRRIRVEDFRIIGGPARHNGFLVFGDQCDNVDIDGVYFIGVGSSSPPIARGYISIDSLYGLGTNESGQAPVVSIRNVHLEPGSPNPEYPLIRLSNTSANYTIEDVTGPVTGPMVQVQYLAAGSIVRNVYSSANATPISVEQGGQAGNWSSRIAYAKGLEATLDTI